MRAAAPSFQQHWGAAATCQTGAICARPLQRWVRWRPATLPTTAGRRGRTTGTSGRGMPQLRDPRARGSGRPPRPSVTAVIPPGQIEMSTVRLQAGPVQSRGGRSVGGRVNAPRSQRAPLERRLVTAAHLARREGSLAEGSSGPQGVDPTLGRPAPRTRRLGRRRRLGRELQCRLTRVESLPGTAGYWRPPNDCASAAGAARTRAAAPSTDQHRGVAATCQIGARGARPSASTGLDGAPRGA